MFWVVNEVVIAMIDVTCTTNNVINDPVFIVGEGQQDVTADPAPNIVLCWNVGPRKLSIENLKMVVKPPENSFSNGEPPPPPLRGGYLWLKFAGWFKR